MRSSRAAARLESMSTSRMTTMLALPAAAALAVSLAACTDSNTSEATVSPDATTGSPPASAPETSEAAASPSTDASASASASENSSLPKAGSDAIDTVLKAYPGEAIGLDFDDRDGTWKVEVITEDRAKKLEVRTNAEGSEAGAVEHEHTPDGRDVKALDSISVPLLDAINRVMNEFPGTFDEADLELENGKAYWSVEVDRQGGEDAEKLVDIQTGDISDDD